jgi:hypothetical protein
VSSRYWVPEPAEKTGKSKEQCVGAKECEQAQQGSRKECGSPVEFAEHKAGCNGDNQWGFHSARKKENRQSGGPEESCKSTNGRAKQRHGQNC